MPSAGTWLLALIVRHQAPRDTKKTSLTASGFEFLNFDVIFEFSDIILSLDVTSLVRGEVGVLNYAVSYCLAGPDLRSTVICVLA